MVRQAIDNGLYDHFVFGDGAKRPEPGPVPGRRPPSATCTAPGPRRRRRAPHPQRGKRPWVNEYGALPVLAYVKEAYDATIAPGACGRRAAGRLDGAEIRDRLRAVGSAPGTDVNAGPERASADALRIPRRMAGRSITKGALGQHGTGTRPAIFAAAISASGASPGTNGSRRSGLWRSRTSPHFSPRSRPASRPGVRSARSGPKSVSGNTVKARDDAGGRLGTTRRAVLSGRQRASRRSPDAPHRASRRSCPIGRTAPRRP